MQRAADKFERRDPFEHIPFALDDAESLQSLPEVLGWIVLGAAFLGLGIGFLGVA